MRVALAVVMSAMLLSPALANEAVKCVQSELNTLGFNAGAIDGVVGPQTFNAGEAYIRYMKRTAGSSWAQPSLTAGNAAHWCEKVAEAHPRVARYWRAYQQSQ